MPSSEERPGHRHQEEEQSWTSGRGVRVGERLTVVGRTLQPGDLAPDFALDSLDPNTSTMRVVRLGDSAGMVRLLNVVNSLDTPVCRVDKRRWETLLEELPPEVRLYTISMDLPYARARWRTAEAATHEVLSAHKSEASGRVYGVLLKEWRLLQRAVLVIGRDDRITYAEYVSDQMAEPDYYAAVQAARTAASA
jgi:thiol peroxidase